MSRLSKRPIELPAGVTATMADGRITIKGPKGELVRDFRDEILIEFKDNAFTLAFNRSKVDVFLRSLIGTYASHLKNMITGVTTGYQKKLILEGVGYKSAITGKTLDLALGFSHPVKVTVPDELTVTADKNIVTISGIDKEQVGEFSAKVRALKKPEPYKGKGFRYDDEVIRRKQGKKTA